MPRVLKADLLLENECLRRQLASMEENKQLREEMAASRLARVRSRSPRRVEEVKELTYGALNVVCKLERDAYVQGLQETIIKQQKEIQDLKDGGGQIGELLLALRKKDSPAMVGDFVRSHLAKSTMTVLEWVRNMERHTNVAHDLAFWGRCRYNLTWAPASQ